MKFKQFSWIVVLNSLFKKPKYASVLISSPREDVFCTFVLQFTNPAQVKTTQIHEVFKHSSVSSTKQITEISPNCTWWPFEGATLDGIIISKLSFNDVVSLSNMFNENNDRYVTICFDL